MMINEFMKYVKEDLLILSEREGEIVQIKAILVKRAHCDCDKRCELIDASVFVF